MGARACGLRAPQSPWCARVARAPGTSTGHGGHLVRDIPLSLLKIFVLTAVEIRN
jgi:hypothetical protein